MSELELHSLATPYWVQGTRCRLRRLTLDAGLSLRVYRTPPGMPTLASPGATTRHGTILTGRQRTTWPPTSRD